MTCCADDTFRPPRLTVEKCRAAYRTQQGLPNIEICHRANHVAIVRTFDKLASQILTESAHGLNTGSNRRRAEILENLGRRGLLLQCLAHTVRACRSSLRRRAFSIAMTA